MTSIAQSEIKVTSRLSPTAFWLGVPSVMRTITRPALVRNWILGLGFVLGAGAAAHARLLDSAATKADIDLQASQSLRDGKAQAVDPNELLDVLGLGAKTNPRTWSAGAVSAEGELASFRYVVALKRSVAIGSIFVQASGQRLGLLKSDAAYPPDAQDRSAWIFPRPAAGQSGAVLYTVPEGTTTRALLIVDDREAGGSSVAGLTVFKQRWQNLTPAALAYAGHEYTAPRSPNTFFASHVTEGSGDWASSGPDSTGRVSTPDINDINPEWFMLAWNQPQVIHGLWLDSNLQTVTIDSYAGPDSLNPRVGTPREWRPLKKLVQHVDRGRWIVFDEPIRTRGLRLNILKTEKTPRVATIHGLQVFGDLADRPPTDETAGSLAADRPPFRFPYRLGAGSEMTLVVNDVQGRRARNLLARQPAAAGRNSKPGTSEMKTATTSVPAIISGRPSPGRSCRRPMNSPSIPMSRSTAPENPPWLTGINGPGGWMADHTAPIAVCAAGDRVYFGSLVAESGVSFIECDLTGKKLWAHQSFAAWTGPRYLASDGKTVFVGSQVLGETPDTVWGVDIATRQVRQFLAVAPTSERKRGMKGLSTHGGKLAMSIDAAENWLTNATVAEDVDLAACYPLYRPAASLEWPTRSFLSRKRIFCGCFA